jgi:hypothetical protein
MQEVHALTYGAPALNSSVTPSQHSTAQASLVSSSSTAGQSRHAAGKKVSSLQNLVGSGSKERTASRAEQAMQASAVPALDSERQPSEAQQEAVHPVRRVSQRHTAIRLMTPEGTAPGAQLLSAGDLAAASAEPGPGQPPGSMQAGAHAHSLEAAAVALLLHGSSRSTAGAELSAEQFPGTRSGRAVLVGEDEEFSVSPGELCSQ